MKIVSINGESYEVRALYEEDISPGTLLYGRYVRKAFRILMDDSGEWIIRDMRYSKIVDVATTDWILANCNRLEPTSG